MSETKKPTSRKKVFFICVFILLSVIVIWRVNAMINSKQSGPTDGKKAMTEYLKSLEKHKDLEVDLEKEN